MEPKSSPTDSNDPYHSHAYDGAIISEPNTGQKRCYNASRKKSKVRLNDQLIPKPTDINMAEKMIKFPTPKEHPHSSHISKFAVFPSYRSPDDPQTGVRAASQPFLSPLVPNRAPDVTVLTKTKGSPYRHEILENPSKTRNRFGNGFYDQTKPSKGENQVFHPTPPKAVLPNPKLRDWDLSLSERTCNMLKNLERTHWITSYQMHYTGSGPVNPLKIDDFKERISDPTRRNSHSAQLRESSFPVFVPSKPTEGCKRSHGQSTCSPSAAEPSNLFTAPNQGSALTTINHHGPQEITAGNNEDPDLNQKSRSRSQEVFKQQTEGGNTEHERRERESPVQFDKGPVPSSVSQSSQKANSDLHVCPFSQGEMEVMPEKRLIESGAKDEPRSEVERFKAGRNVSSLSSPCILPRPLILPGIDPVSKRSLMDLQNSFSKTAAHRNFNNTVTNPVVNLRDNVVTGKKHNFYGINSFYLHG